MTTLNIGGAADGLAFCSAGRFRFVCLAGSRATRGQFSPGWSFGLDNGLPKMRGGGKVVVRVLPASQIVVHNV